MAFVLPSAAATTTSASSLQRSAFTPTINARRAPDAPRVAPSKTRTPSRAVLAPPPKQTPSVAPDQWDPSRICFLPGTVHSVTTPGQFDALQRQAQAEGALLVADFMAAWCRKCLYLLPRLAKIAAQHPTVYFCTVDVNKVARLPRQFSIRRMPTFVFIKDARPIHTFVAGASAPTVANELQRTVDKLVAANAQ